MGTGRTSYKTHGCKVILHVGVGKESTKNLFGRSLNIHRVSHESLCERFARFWGKKGLQYSTGTCTDTGRSCADWCAEGRTVPLTDGFLLIHLYSSAVITIASKQYKHASSRAEQLQHNPDIGRWIDYVVWPGFYASDRDFLYF